ncbi:MAG: hypothetical protein WCK90_01855 [archaeon]
MRLNGEGCFWQGSHRPLLKGHNFHISELYVGQVSGARKSYEGHLDLYVDGNTKKDEKGGRIWFYVTPGTGVRRMQDGTGERKIVSQKLISEKDLDVIIKKFILDNIQEMCREDRLH